jgi:hypothetical protein
MAQVSQSQIKKLRFTFLDIEFKSQAKNGTHYIATSQVAGAGAIALNGNMGAAFEREVSIMRNHGFFPVTMDHQLICV